MAKLPTTLGDSQPTPTPQRRVMGYDSQTMPNAMYQAGQSMERDAKVLQAKVDKDAVLDAQKRANEAKKRLLDFQYGDGKNEGLYSATGGAALGSEEKFKTAYTAIRNMALDGVTNPTAQKALSADLDSMELSHLDNVKRFEMTQRKGYTTDLTNAQQQIDAQRAGLEFNNQKSIDDLLASAEKTGVASAKIKGAMPGDVIWKQEITNARSNILSSQLLAMSRSQDIETMRQFVGKYNEYQKSGQLSPDAVKLFDGMIAKVEPFVNAADGIGKIRWDQINYANIPDSKIEEAISVTESGGQMFNPDGTVVTSYAGAKGTMQIMPDTALAIAKGDQKLADKIIKDPEYNREAGKVYYGQMKKKYGDVRMALTAYNAGPGRVDDYINGTNKSGKNPENLKFGDPAKGEITVDQFIARMPVKEHREYANKTVRNAGYGGKEGIISEDTAVAAAAQMNEPTREEFLKMVKQNNEAFTAQTKADLNATSEQIVKILDDTSGNWMAVPPELVARAQDIGAWNAIKDYSPTMASNTDVVESLYAMDAKELQAADLGAPEIVGGLSKADRMIWTNKKNSITSTSVAVTHDIRKKMVADAMAGRKMDVVDPGPVGAQNRARAVRVNKLIDAMVDVYSQNNGNRMPGRSDLQKMVDDVFIQEKVDIPGTNKHIYDVNVTDISKSDRQIISDRLAMRGIAATDARIIEMYLRNQE